MSARKESEKEIRKILEISANRFQIGQEFGLQKKFREKKKKIRELEERLREEAR